MTIGKVVPSFGQTDLNESGSIVGTEVVKGDIHDIGKNIVVTLLKNADFRVIDMGIDTPADQLFQRGSVSPMLSKGAEVQ